MNKQAVTYEIQDNIGIIKGTNQPVNALSFEVRKGLIDALRTLLDNTFIEGIVLCGEGKTFFAGADISEFGKPMQLPNLNDVVFEFENSKKAYCSCLTWYTSRRRA